MDLFPYAQTVRVLIKRLCIEKKPIRRPHYVPTTATRPMCDSSTCREHLHIASSFGQNKWCGPDILQGIKRYCVFSLIWAFCVNVFVVAGCNESELSSISYITLVLSIFGTIVVWRQIRKNLRAAGHGFGFPDSKTPIVLRSTEK
jgi:hypothetical protein